MGLAICSFSEVILINGKNTVNLSLEVNITVIILMVKNHNNGQPDFDVV